MQNRVGKVLTPTLCATGYPTVTPCCDGAKTTEKIHVLVAEAFLGPKPAGLVVCHRDGDRTNNRAENLRYGTYSENVADAVEHGTWAHGERHVTTATVSDWSGVPEIVIEREVRRVEAARFELLTGTGQQQPDRTPAPADVGECINTAIDDAVGIGDGRSTQRGTT